MEPLPKHLKGQPFPCHRWGQTARITITLYWVWWVGVILVGDGENGGGVVLTGWADTASASFPNAVNVVVDNAGPQVVADSPSPSPLLSSIGYRPTRGRWNACASNRQHRQDRPLHVSPNAVGWSNTSSNYLDRSGNRDCHSTNTLTSRSTFVDGDRTPVRAPTGVSADTAQDRLARMSDLPPIPEGATGWDYERLNGKAYLIMALDEMVCLADSGLQRRGISEESRSRVLG